MWLQVLLQRNDVDRVLVLDLDVHQARRPCPSASRTMVMHTRTTQSSRNSICCSEEIMV